MLYIIFKESLYCYIKSCHTIKGIELPNNNSLKISGYADDTNMYTIDNESIVNIFNVITMFEAATGAILNKRKTKIYGIGAWKNKIEWPIPWLTSSTSFFESLGVIFSNDYQLAVLKNWESILNSIEIKLRIMQTIKLTIYQKAVMINCIINARLWYISHVYPMPLKYANKIKRVTFHYLWGKKYEPIKRTTLTLPKYEGGLGIIDIYYKSQSILASSFLKSYMNENGIQYMTIYYNHIRCAQLLNITSNPRQVSYVGNDYYREIISTIQKCTHIQGFPHISSKLIYANIKTKHNPTIEMHYGLYKWKSIWNNLCSAFILLNERETLFKYLHEILPTKKRLKDIHSIACSKCDYCTQEESNIHVVYQCEHYIEVTTWFKRILYTFCELRDPQLIKLSFLIMPKLNLKMKNTVIFLMSTYIVSIWQSRQNNMDPYISIKYIKGKMLHKQRMVKYLLGDRMESLLSHRLYNLKWSDL